MLIAANGHPMMFEAMRDARRRGITTAFAVRGYGYDRPSVLCRRRPRVHVQRVSLRGLSREDRADQYATRAAARLVDGRRAGRIPRLRHLRQSSAAQRTVLVRAPCGHARLATARHPGAGGAVRPERRQPQQHSRDRLQSLSTADGGAAGPDAARVLRLDADPSGAVGLGRAVRPRRRRSDGQRRSPRLFPIEVLFRPSWKPMAMAAVSCVQYPSG